jgi:hypothetical protein
MSYIIYTKLGGAMRFLFLILAISMLLPPISCKNKSTQTQPPSQYDKMLFIRQGGGDKAFNVLPTKAQGTFQIIINHLDFHDTTITLTLTKDSANAAVFNVLTKTLDGKYQLTGDFTQPSLPTGTWAHLYMIKGDIKTEITNTQLRNTLIVLENIVVNNIK